jgi:hypothetical protein
MLSRSPAGECTAVGYYADRGGQVQEFAVNSTQGRWGRAAPLPGLAALNVYGYVEVGPVPGAARLNVGGEAGISSVPAGPDGAVYAVATGSRNRELQAFAVTEKGISKDLP